MNQALRFQERPMKNRTAGRGWWREPMMWVVVGGLGFGVVAASTMAVISIRGADEVIDTREPTAMQSRNHAATPGGVPAAKP